MGRGPDLANLVAAAAQGSARQGCKRWKGLGYGAALNKVHPQPQVIIGAAGFTFFFLRH